MMAVEIGTVSTFADVKADKAQVVKILEESAEVFSAWETLCNWRHDWCNDGQGEIAGDVSSCYKLILIDECADVIQTVCNFLAALGVNDLTPMLNRCKQKNIERGREYGR